MLSDILHNFLLKLFWVWSPDENNIGHSDTWNYYVLKHTYPHPIFFSSIAFSEFWFWKVLSFFYFGTFYISWLDKAMAPHSSTLAWKIPWTEEPGKLQSLGSQGVGHVWATSLSIFTFMHWRRKWQSTPMFLPGESQGPGSLVGCRL